MVVGDLVIILEESKNYGAYRFYREPVGVDIALRDDVLVPRGEARPVAIYLGDVYGSHSVLANLIYNGMNLYIEKELVCKL